MNNEPVIIGAGIAGLATALYLAPQPVTVVNKGKFATGSTRWAQGGVAAAILKEDTPAAHAADTIAVGGGLVDPAVAEMVAAAGPAAIEALENWGVRFDRDAEGNLMPGLEAGHSAKRIVHAGGDATGHEIIDALTARARATPSITLLEDTAATALTRDDQGVSGVYLNNRWVASRRIVIATGGLGHLFADTTNPPGSNGDGIRLAAEIGAVCRDLEFIQFHPTAIDLGRDPMPLATEALRGQGARLIDNTGEFVMAGQPAGDLSARDVVARAIWHVIESGGRVFLDCRAVSDFAGRFPTVLETCRSAHIDPRLTPIPVRPAAHYHMGGVEVDADGRSSVEGLWVCGEAASTGLHGANRLASNSLLEAIVFARRVAESIQAFQSSPSLRAGEGDITPPHPALSPDGGEGKVPPGSYRSLFEEHVGVTRDEAGLIQAVRTLAQPALAGDRSATLPLMIALAALNRKESRGAHSRTDFPETMEIAEHSRMTLAEALDTAKAYA